MTAAASFQEDFLHYVWRHQYFDKTDLVTAQNEPVQVFKPGFYNTDAGPDFTGARLKIGLEEWNGSVEIHINASDWLRHGHQTDPKYDQVVLHVVWENDAIITRTNGSIIPTLALRGRIALPLVNTYRQFLHSSDRIPCQPFLPQVPGLIKTAMQERVRMERLTAKADRVLGIFESNGHDWEATTYAWLAANFGFKINQVGMERLAQALPYAVLRRHRHQLPALEALLLGQAGFLTALPPDDYLAGLQREYTYLHHKYTLPVGLQRADWKFLRLRPANFPPVRLAQLAALLHQHEHLFAALREITDLKTGQAFFQVTSSAYWQTHIMPGHVTTRSPKGIGKSSIYLMLINAVAPLLVAYGRYQNHEEYIDRAVQLLEQLPPEDNHITRLYTDLDFHHQTAADSQALLQLHQHYCAPRQCLQCSIGNYILKRNQPG